MKTWSSACMKSRNVHHDKSQVTKDIVQLTSSPAMAFFTALGVAVWPPSPHNPSLRFSFWLCRSSCDCCIAALAEDMGLFMWQDLASTCSLSEAEEVGTLSALSAEVLFMLSPEDEGGACSDRCLFWCFRGRSTMGLLSLSDGFAHRSAASASTPCWPRPGQDSTDFGTGLGALSAVEGLTPWSEPGFSDDWAVGANEDAEAVFFLLALSMLNTFSSFLSPDVAHANSQLCKKEPEIKSYDRFESISNHKQHIASPDHNWQTANPNNPFQFWLVPRKMHTRPRYSFSYDRFYTMKHTRDLERST